jgi:DNA-binding NarL/FixJ family response regulator
MCKAVKAVAQRELWVDRKLACQVLQESLQQSSQPSVTPRERQILRMITEGKTNRTIADTLHVTRDTVRWHIKSLYNKIGVKDRLSAVFFAREFFGADVSPGRPVLNGKRPAPSVDLSEFQSRSEQLGRSR